MPYRRRAPPARARHAGRTALLPRRAAGRPARSGGLWPGLDRRLGPAVGRRGRGRGRHDLGGGRQRGDRRPGGPGDQGPRQRPGDGDAGIHGRPPALHRRRLPARQRGPPAGQLARPSSSSGSRRSPPSGSRANGSSAATGTTSAGPARRCRARTGSTRSPRTTRSCSTGSTDTWRWPTAPRSGWPGSTGRRRTSPAASSCAIRRTGEPTGILKDEAMGPVQAVIPEPDRRAARRRAQARAWSTPPRTASPPSPT